MRSRESEKSAEAAENLAEALRIEAQAEGDAAQSLKIVRDHQLEMAKLEVKGLLLLLLILC